MGFKIASVVVDFANMLLLLSINISLGDELLVATCEKWWKSNLINRIYLLLLFFLLGQIFPFTHRKGYAWYRNEQIVLHIIIINLQHKSTKCLIYSTSTKIFLIKGFIDSCDQYWHFIISYNISSSSLRARNNNYLKQMRKSCKWKQFRLEGCYSC